MPQDTYAAQADAAVARIKGLMKVVRDESAQRLIEVMQTPVGAGGRMRVDTGFLRASLMAVIGEPNFAVRANPGGDGVYSYSEGAISLVIAGASIEDTISVVYTANYARPREYGARGQAPDAFVRTAAQQWQRIVSEVAVEAQRRAGA
jgi:hypothetical protein